MKRLLLALLLMVPLNVNGEDYKCPGQNTIEMEYCSSIDLKKSSMWLEDQLSEGVLSNWRDVTYEVCSAIYEPYKDGTIYSRMLIECADRLNRALLDEGLG
jgi:hypothetical protein